MRFSPEFGPNSVRMLSCYVNATG
ncbi:MAG: hypothetical protein QOF76_1176, partial [Solirubrobacteraceae bacterium]|nr:hypothetical protein [Solirubrobacteraceae bacterium]